jgi:hypothetical protein
MITPVSMTSLEPWSGSWPGCPRALRSGDALAPSGAMAANNLGLSRRCAAGSDHARDRTAGLAGAASLKHSAVSMRRMVNAVVGLASG